MKQDARLSFFFAGCLFLILANLLIGNDLSTLWSGAETRFVWEAISGEPANYLPYRVAGGLAGGKLNMGLLRLPGALLFLLGGLACFWMIRPVLGRIPSLFFLVVLGSSLLMSTLAKVASADIWAFSFQLAAFSATLRFLKQPRWKWRLVFYLSAAVALWIQPLSTALFFSLFSGMLWLKHPQGREMLRLQPWMFLAAAGLALHLAGWLDWDRPVFYIDFQAARHLLLNFLGMLPFLGFLAAGIWETLAKIRKGEELAIINTAWMVAAIAGQSLLLQAAFAFLVSKQLQLYFHEAYPYRKMVRGIAVVHLVGAFFLAMILMIKGYSTFGATGFRSGMAFGAVYWMASLVGVIGLFGQKRRLLWGALMSAALFATLLFWARINPLLESRRDLPKRIVRQAAERKKEPRDRLIVLRPSGEERSKVELYATVYFSDVEALSDEPAFSLLSETEEQAVFAAPSDRLSGSGPVPQDAVRLEGWNDLLAQETWVVFPGAAGRR